MLLQALLESRDPLGRRDRLAKQLKAANAWRKIKKSRLLFTTSRPNIGHIYERLTSSNPPSR
jgi:hypothetical protein